MVDDGFDYEEPSRDHEWYKGREGLELRAVHRDYGQCEYMSRLIHPVSLPRLGNAFYVVHPNHLVKIAADLSRWAELRPVDVFRGCPAVGWTTGLTTVLIRLRDLRESFLRHDGDGTRSARPELVGRANAIASWEFRERFCDGWPAMVGQYPFIVAPDIVG